MATITTLGSVSGIDINNSNAFSDRFVFNKALELPKSPLMHPFVVSGSSPDITQVFQHDSISTSEIIHDVLTDVVVLPSHQPFPPTRQSFELSLAGSRVFALEFCHKIVSVQSLPLEILTIKPAVRSDGKLVYSKVDAQNSILDIRALDTDLFGKHEKEETSALFVHSQQTFINTPLKILQITSRNFEGDLDSTFDGGDAQDVILERSRAGEVVSHRSSLDDWPVLCSLNHSTSLLDTCASKLGLQAKRTQLFINKRMQFDIIPNVMFPSGINTELQSFGIYFERANYLRSCLNFDFGCRPDVHKLEVDEIIFKLNGGIGFSSLQQDCSVSKPKRL